jgi:hypothetical protein
LWLGRVANPKPTGSKATAQFNHGKSDEISGLVERPDDGADVLRELTELPKDVESYRDVQPRDFIQGHLTRIEAASGESV